MRYWGIIHQCVLYLFEHIYSNEAKHKILLYKATIKQNKESLEILIETAATKDKNEFLTSKNPEELMKWIECFHRAKDGYSLLLNPTEAGPVDKSFMSDKCEGRTGLHQELGENSTCPAEPSFSSQECDDMNNKTKESRGGSPPSGAQPLSRCIPPLGLP